MFILNIDCNMLNLIALHLFTEYVHVSGFNIPPWDVGPHRTECPQHYEFVWGLPQAVRAFFQQPPPESLDIHIRNWQGDQEGWIKDAL